MLASLAERGIEEPLEGVDTAEDREGCNEFERVLLGDLQILQKYLQRVLVKFLDPRLKSRAFYAQANLLTAALWSKFDPFYERLKAFHDRSGQA